MKHISVKHISFTYFSGLSTAFFSHDNKNKKELRQEVTGNEDW